MKAALIDIEVRIVIISVTTEEHDLMRDVGMKSMVEDFKEEQRITF